MPLKFVNAKFQPGALKGWLMNPQEHYAWTRMPDFRLTEFEADRLVAYLAEEAAKGSCGRSKGDAAKGKALFASVGCANCHKMKGRRAELAAKSMAELRASRIGRRGAWRRRVAGKAPDFGLSAEQRGALTGDRRRRGLGSMWNDVLAGVRGAVDPAVAVHGVSCAGRGGGSVEHGGG